MARRLSVAALIASAVWSAFPASAQAYCRTTTCDPKLEDCRVDENGCTRTGAPLTWRTLPITYRFHAKGSKQLDRREAREAVRAAFARWSFVACGNGKRTSLRFEEGEDISMTMPADPHHPAAQHFGIYFRDDEWTATDSDATLALTTQSFKKINGWVEQSDIEVNTATAAFTTTDTAAGIDLQAVIAHEVGHYIGLAHSQDPDSIMVDAYCKSGERCGNGKVDARKLSFDDENAVCALFPPEGISGVTYEEPDEGGCAVAPRGRTMPWLPFVGAAFVLAALQRRVRRARALDQ